MASEDEYITVEKVALGPTMPVMKFGLPIAAMAIIFAVSVELVLIGFIALKNPLFGLVGAPLYFLAKARARKEPRFIELMAAAARTRWFNRGKRHWKATTYSPLTHRKSVRRFK